MEAKWFTPQKIAIFISAVLSVAIMFLAFIRSGDEEPLQYVIFAAILFGTDFLLCEKINSKYSAVMAVLFIFLNAVGMGLILLNGSSVISTLLIIAVAITTAFIFFKLMRAVSEWIYRSKRNTVITLTVIGCCTVACYLVLFLFPKINNARAWIVIGKFTFQLTEITKLLFLVSLSVIFASPHIRRQVICSLIFLGMNIIFLCIHNELGTAFVIAITWLIVQFIFTKTKQGLMIVFVSFIAAMFIIMTVTALYNESGGANGQDILSTIVNKIYLRIFPTDTYQTDIALQSFVNGGILGASHDYVLDIPIAESDFAFANLCQRFGALFGIIVILSFVVMIFDIYKFSDECDIMAHDFRLSLIFIIVMTVQMSIVVFTNTGVLATIGICAPFISEGGSQCVITYTMALYIVSAMSPQVRKIRKKRIKREEIFEDETKMPL